MKSMEKFVRKHFGLFLFLSLMGVFRSAVADWNYVPSSSMNPTIYAGDRVLVNKLAYNLRVPFTLKQVTRWNAPHRGDVITFDSPESGVNLIKRVVAVEGDVVSMVDNQLVINGKVQARKLVEAERVVPTEAGPLSEEIWQETLDGRNIQVARLPMYNRHTDFDPIRVPNDHVMVLGDSRDNSHDSRFIGFIDTNRITGKAVRVVASHDPDSYYMLRGDRWWKVLN